MGEIATTRPELSKPARRKSGAPSALQITLRALAALPGGYSVAALWSALAARVLPLAASEAVTAATLSAFVIHAAFALWCFAARTTLKVWLSLVFAGILLGGGIWLSYALAPAP